MLAPATDPNDANIANVRAITYEAMKAALACDVPPSFTNESGWRMFIAREAFSAARTHRGRP